MSLIVAQGCVRTDQSRSLPVGICRAPATLWELTSNGHRAIALAAVLVGDIEDRSAPAPGVDFVWHAVVQSPIAPSVVSVLDAEAESAIAPSVVFVWSLQAESVIALATVFVSDTAAESAVALACVFALGAEDVIARTEDDNPSSRADPLFVRMTFPVRIDSV